MGRACRRSRVSMSGSFPGAGSGGSGGRIRPRLSAGGGGSSGGRRPPTPNTFFPSVALLLSAGAAAAAAASLLVPLTLLQPAMAASGRGPYSGTGHGTATAACGLGCTEGACVRAVDPAPYYGGYYGPGTPDTVFPHRGYRTEAACLSCRDGCYFLATRPNSWITYCGCKRGCGIVPGALVTRCEVRGKKKRRQLLGGGGHAHGSVATSPVLSGSCGLGPQIDCRPCPVDWYQPLDGFEFAECRPCEPGSTTRGQVGQDSCLNTALPLV